MPLKGYNPVLIQTLIADVAIDQWTAVVAGTSDYHGTYGAAANAGKFIGVAQDAGTVGETTPIVELGTVWVKATSAISYGDQLIIGDASGGVASVGATTSPNIIGTALSSATAAGDLILMKIGQ